MEGRKGKINLRRLAFQQYMSSTQKARYTSLAQKLAQHINHLAEDKNTRIRWIWELIQNAKDVPNEFEKSKILVQIRDDKLTFAHNGNPFRVSDLQSLVAQYSSKEEQNNPNTETTGKYGTGFIVTYILSKKIRIKGLLEMKIQESELEEEATKIEKKEQIQGEDEDNLELCQEEQIINKKQNIKQNATQPSEVDQDQSNGKKEQFLQKNLSGNYYQKFDILLDREYKDRDRQLYYKLMESQHNLMNDLLKIEPQPKWQRNEDQLNTQFIYQDIDQVAHKMINESMVCLKELFPYALLFNPKLFQLKVIDKRKHKIIKNFTIKKQSEEVRNGLKIFNVSIQEEEFQTARKFSLAYIQDEYTYSTIAIPLEIKKNSIKLLEMNSKFPKMFKEFPLIGCKDTGFNFAFTSKRFYPNENRSNLLLEQIQGRDSKKTKTNWSSLVSIFEKGLQLYEKVSRMIDSGRQNLFIVSLQNHFSQQVFNKKNMRGIYQKYIQVICSLNCIAFRNNETGKVKSLIFPLGNSENNQFFINKKKQYCLELNSVFALILGAQATLSDSDYQGFYRILQTENYVNTWQNNIKFPDINACIIKLSSFNFAQIVKIANGNQQNALNVLRQVYEFLLQHHPQYLKKNNGNNKPCNKFILTNNKKLKDINEKLYRKQNVPQAYEEIGKYLSIDLNEITIYNDFSSYFNSISYFRTDNMIGLFEGYFFITQNSAQNLTTLGRFITTFSITTEVMSLAKKIKQLYKIDQPFQIQHEANILPLNNKVKMQFRLLFEIKIMLYVNQLMQENQSLAKFMQLTQFAYNESQKAIQWFNNVFQFEETLLTKSNTPEFMKGYTAAASTNNRPKNLIQRNLSLQLKWVPLSNLKYFCSKRGKGNYPDKKDLQMHQKMRKVYNRRAQNFYNFTAKINLESQILYEAIQYKLPNSTTYQNQFGFITQVYHNSQHIYQQQKIQILDYIYHLRQSAVKNRQFQFKILTFQKLEQNAYFLYPTMTKCLKGLDNQIYAFKMIKNQQEVISAKEITQEYGSLYKALKQLRSIKTQSQKTISE